jgi:hypothetical protein
VQHILAFDPGETTGFVAGMFDGDKDFGLLRCEEIPWENRFSRTWKWLQFYQPDYIVVEAFRLYPHRAMEQIGKDFPSSQFIGIISAYAWKLQLPSITLQPASVRSSVKVLPEHRTMIGTSKHIVDAYRHLRYFIIVNLLAR